MVGCENLHSAAWKHKECIIQTIGDFSRPNWKRKRIKALHLLKMRKFKMLLPYFISPHSIKALTISFDESANIGKQGYTSFTNVSIERSIITSMCHRPVIAKLVHEGIQHGWGAMSINTVVAILLEK